MNLALKSLANGDALSSAAAETVMSSILAGEAKPEQIGAFLTAFHFRPPSGQALAGFVRAFRSDVGAVQLTLPDAIDVCGTGGDGLNTFNISTAVAFVAGAAGVKVAKHGNRAVSSRAGSFDVLEALGVPFSETADHARASLDRHGLAFLYAPSFHPSMRQFVSVRQLLGFRTIFNVLGPLLNPASVGRQLIGVYAESLVVPVAEALAELGAHEVMVVHGLDGSDEFSLHAPTRVAHLRAGSISVSTVDPMTLGLNRASAHELVGGDAKENSRILRAIFAGETSARQDVVSLNAAAALLIGGQVGGLSEGLAQAREVLLSGAALRLLKRMNGEIV